MNEELCKDLLRFKLSFAQRVTQLLPQAMQAPLKELETKLLQCMYDVTKEYVAKVPAGENNRQAAGGLKSIDVE